MFSMSMNERITKRNFVLLDSNPLSLLLHISSAVEVCVDEVVKIGHRSGKYCLSPVFVNH